jgi:ribosomal protein L16 Arg81 hydroxylase
MPNQSKLTYTPVIHSPEQLSACVEDAIANELDNLNHASGESFCDIEELYTAYMDNEKMIKDQDLQIIQLQMKLEEKEKELKQVKLEFECQSILVKSQEKGIVKLQEKLYGDHSDDEDIDIPFPSVL